MKAMRYILVSLLVLLLVSAAACGAQNATKPSEPPTSPTAPVTSTVPKSTVTPEPTGDPASSGEQTFQGTVDEVKTTMLIITGDKEEAYVFQTDGLDSSALEGIQPGDQVTVTYTGDLSSMDAALVITGIEKAA